MFPTGGADPLRELARVATSARDRNPQYAGESIDGVVKVATVGYDDAEAWWRDYAGNVGGKSDSGAKGLAVEGVVASRLVDGNYYIVEDSQGKIRPLQLRAVDQTRDGTLKDGTPVTAQIDFVADGAGSPAFVESKCLGSPVGTEYASQMERQVAAAARVGAFVVWLVCNGLTGPMWDKVSQFIGDYNTEIHILDFDSGSPLNVYYQDSYAHGPQP
jgi:hypothetical protein